MKVKNWTLPFVSIALALILFVSFAMEPILMKVLKGYWRGYSMHSEGNVSQVGSVTKFVVEIEFEDYYSLTWQVPSEGNSAFIDNCLKTGLGCETGARYRVKVYDKQTNTLFFSDEVGVFVGHVGRDRENIYADLTRIKFPKGTYEISIENLQEIYLMRNAVGTFRFNQSFK